MRDSPSKTALIIAHIVLILGGDARGRDQLPPDCLKVQKELLKAANLPFGQYPFAISNPIFSKLARWVVHAVFSPKLLEAVGFRKMYIENKVRRAISSTGKTQQVLVIAGGYDTMALRLSQDYPQVSFWEVDHPATGKVKERAMSQMSSHQNDNLHLIQADLTICTLSQAMMEWNSKNEPKVRFDDNAQTVVIVEGLTMYLTRDLVITLFSDIAKTVGTQSLVCFDYLAWNHSTNRADLGASWIPGFLLNKLGEPWKWGLDSTRLVDFVNTNLSMYTVLDQPPRIGIENLATVQLDK